MEKSEKNEIIRNIILFTITSFFLGILFPVLAYVVDQFYYEGAILDGNFFSNHPFYQIISLAPFVLGTLGFMIGLFYTKLRYSTIKLGKTKMEIEMLRSIVFQSNSEETIEKLSNFKPDNLEVDFLKNTLLERTNIIYKMKTDLTERSSEFLLVLANMISRRDDVTGEHNYRVAYALCMMVNKYEEKYGKTFNNYDIIKGSLLHDIGKISISDIILLKPGKFTVEEREIMKTHTTVGADIVSNFKQLRAARNIVLSHHEDWDGSGYPIGLKGKQIPIETRMFSIVDVFDALMSKRPYKDSFSVNKALKIMKENTGVKFCPESMEIFYELVDDLVLSIYTKNSTDVYQKVVDLIAESSDYNL